MRTIKVVESVDVAAPRDRLFTLIASCERRLQFSPLWGTSKISDVTPDFPEPGSSYRASLLTGAEEYDTIVTELIPDQKFAYRLTARRQPNVTWTLQDVTNGTRLIYHEEFLVEESGEDEDFVQAVRGVVREWLNNIKRYSELGDAWTHRFLKWLLDRWLLKLRTDQRRVILALLAMQGMMIISFIALALGWALISLLSSY